MSLRKKKVSFVCNYLSFSDLSSQPPRPYRLPLVHVRIKESGRSLRTIALVDSGSTGTFIPLEEASILELELKGEQKTIGAGGTFKASRAKLELLQVFKGSTAFCEFHKLDILVHDSIPYIILGRDSIFRQFYITFREKEEHIIFRNSKR